MGGTAEQVQRLEKQAREHQDRAEWELAENCLNDALRFCESPGFPDAAQHQVDITLRLADILRRHGRYPEAVSAFQHVLASDRMDKVREIEILGELGVNYRHMDNMEQALTALQKQ